MEKSEMRARAMDTLTRREILRRGSLAAASLLTPVPFAWAQAIPPSPADYRLEITETEWELSPRKKIRTAVYNGQIPGPLLRVTEGKPVTIDIVNRLNHPEIVHWHGQWIPVAVDGAAEEGSPMIPAGGSTRITFTPRPAGLHWYHTHAMAGHSLNLGLYTGQSGGLHVASPSAPGAYDQEQFIVLHDWESYYVPADDGSQMVGYAAASINGRMLGHGDPIQVREGQRVLFQILNASATEPHWLALPGHRFQVLALDGAAVATQASVDLLRLGPAERITALVTMNRPGVWVFGEPRKSFLHAGMGMVVEYAGSTGKPVEPQADALQWDYRVFGEASPQKHTPDITIPMVFTSRFTGQGSLGKWMINGKSWPHPEPFAFHAGVRHRLVFANHSTDDHPIHLHRHNFELVSIRGTATSGVHKDVVVVEAGTTVEADLIPNNPGNTLFHCHQQDHMDAGFMALFRYA
jgi:FtsP/CotA-like multicopper oxidase with cupredoxin domain